MVIEGVNGGEHKAANKTGGSQPCKLVVLETIILCDYMCTYIYVHMYIYIYGMVMVSNKWETSCITEMQPLSSISSVPDLGLSPNHLGGVCANMYELCELSTARPTLTYVSYVFWIYISVSRLMQTFSSTCLKKYFTPM